MSLRKSGLLFGAAALSAVVALSGCSSSDDGGGGDTGSDGGDQGGKFSMAIEKPQVMTPSNCYDLYCAQVNKVLFTGLFDFQQDDSGAMVPVETELTEAVTADKGNKVYTIEISPDFTFTNGEKVTAQTFVDTWNYAANPDNGQQLGFVFGPDQLNVVGFDKLQDGKAKGMSGLKAESPTELSVELVNPMSEALFKNFVGGPQILPMPEVAFKDSKAYEKQPIGNGPYKLESNWNNQGMTVVRNDDYAGTPGNADEIEFKIYADTNTLWTDLQANTLDVTNNLPQNALATAEQVLGDRFINNPGAMQYSYYGFPGNDDTFKEKDVRIGIAKSINWDEINEKIYYNTRTRADSYAPSTVPGGGTDICGDNCVFDAEKAKEMIDDAGGVPGNKVRIPQLSNETGDVQKAICNQIQTNTGVECAPEVFKSFGEMLDNIQSGKAPKGTLVGSGWVADNPTIQNMIAFNFLSNSPGNSIQYENKEFDKLLQEGTASTDEAEQISKWQDAEKVMYEDFQAWAYQFPNDVGGYSTNISNVDISPDGFVNLKDVVVNS